MLVGDLLRKTGEVRSQFARLVNASPEEIGFVFATTEGENIVANSVPMGPGDNVVIDDLCYDGALVIHRELEKRRGIELRIVKNRDGAVRPEDIAARVDRRTRLVSVAWVSHRNGYRHDLRALAGIAHAPHSRTLRLSASRESRRTSWVSRSGCRRDCWGRGSGCSLRRGTSLRW
jgi:selenocysteine lyase/cysteine desulfurase